MASKLLWASVDIPDRETIQEYLSRPIDRKTERRITSNKLYEERLQIEYEIKIQFYTYRIVKALRWLDQYDADLNFRGDRLLEQGITREMVTHNSFHSAIFLDRQIPRSHTGQNQNHARRRYAARRRYSDVEPRANRTYHFQIHQSRISPAFGLGRRMALHVRSPPPRSAVVID